MMQIFSGKFKNRRIQSPEGLHTRPTAGRVRESLFNICQAYVEGAQFLDLFAGSGAIGLEAISRGARFATFIDSSKASIQCIKENIRSLKVEKDSRAVFGDVFLTLEKMAHKKEQFDIIYADPPYLTQGVSQGKMVLYSALVLHYVEEFNLLSPGGELFIEDSHDLPPFETALKNLRLKSSREMGKTLLNQFQRIS